MKQTRTKAKRIIYSLGAIIIGLILLRFFLKLFGASPTNSVINFFYQIAYPFVQPFNGIAPDIVNGTVSVEFSSIIALVIWLAVILIIAELITAFMYDELRDIVINLVDVFFKFIEFFLIARLFMRAFGARLGVNSFVDTIYSIAGIVYTPFEGIAPGINVPTGVIEISTLIALIIVIVLDILTDGFLRSILPEPEKKDTQVNIGGVSQPHSQVNVILGQNYPNSQQPPIVIQNHPGGATYQTDQANQPQQSTTRTWKRR